MKIVALMSGGLDSTVLVAKLLREGHEVKGLSVNYGQRHARELDYAKSVAAILGVERIEIDMAWMSKLLPNCSLTDGAVDVPQGHYAAPSMKRTVVPNRNMMMLSIAAAHALAIGFDGVAFAAHGGDHAIYPDCREEFCTDFEMAVRSGNWNAENFRLLAPFLDKTKAEIVELGDRIDAPMRHTWSCYEGAHIHCGRCGTCVERIEAFEIAGVDDDTPYDLDDEGDAQ